MVWTVDRRTFVAGMGGAGALAASGADPVRIRISLADGADDLVVRFVRLVRVD